MLKANPELIKSAASIRVIQGILQNQGQEFIVECSSMDKMENAESISAEINTMLEEYAHVFHCSKVYHFIDKVIMLLCLKLTPIFLICGHINILVTKMTKLKNWWAYQA